MPKRSRLKRKSSRKQLVRMLKEKSKEYENVVERLDAIDMSEKFDHEKWDRLNEEAFELEQDILRLRAKMSM